MTEKTKKLFYRITANQTKPKGKGKAMTHADDIQDMILKMEIIHKEMDKNMVGLEDIGDYTGQALDALHHALYFVEMFERMDQ